jgi:hypothetical protein
MTSLLNDGLELRAGVVRLMVAVAVCRLHQDDIGGDCHGRVGKNRPVVSAQIAAKENSGSARESHDDEGRTEQVTRGVEFDRDAGRHLNRPFEAERLQVGQRA